MSISSVACYNLAAPTFKRPARKVSSQNLSAAAMIGLVLGCGWTLYANIFAADPYPQVGGADLDAPFARRWVDIAPRTSVAAEGARAARLEPPPAALSETIAASEGGLSFVDRFAAASPQSVAPAALPEEPTKLAVAPKTEALKLAEAPKPRLEPVRSTEAARSKDVPKVQLASATPDSQPEDAPKGIGKIRDMAERAKNAILSIASSDRHSITEKLWGKASSSHNPVLAYASADASITGSIGREQNPMLGGSPPYDRDTAVYDITAHTVYLPDGTKLEAHSGLGPSMDDPNTARIRMRGVTPPHIYVLKPRESLFHGVAALRLTPVGGEDAIFGREGLLAHSFMLGPNGASNGCVSFRDYDAFLSAYHNQGIRKLAVVARVE
jgi:hypothetical protein